MTNVDKILSHKGHAVWSIGPDDSVFEAIKIMEEKGISALLVIQEDTLIGIISERDYARKVILKGRSSRDTLVKEIMTTKVFHTVPEEAVSSCLAKMNHHKVRHLPVLDGEQVVGFISIGDLVKNIIEEQRYTIRHLEHVVSWAESY